MLVPFKNEILSNFDDPVIYEEMSNAIKNVDREKGKQHFLLINGKENTGDQTFLSINPSDEDELLGTFYKGTIGQVDEAINSAWEVFEQWRKFPVEEKSMILIRTAAIMRRQKYDLAATIVFEVGKNWVEADADVAEAIDFCEFYAREALRYSRRDDLFPIPSELNQIRYLPLGVGSVIPPWNFPLAILTGMTTAAIVTGNCVILKPASDSPWIAKKFMDILQEAGLPPGVVNLINGSGPEIGKYLVAHPRIRFVAFTGSMEVGLTINRLAASKSGGQRWIKKVIAEMGGKDAIVIDNNCDMEMAAKGVLSSAFGFQGQKCSACSRAIVHKKVYDEFIDRIKYLTEQLTVGPVKYYKNYLGPLINAEALKKAMHYIQIGLKEGKLVTGGEKVKGKGFFIRPTIFKDVASDAQLAQHEIFSPILAIIKADDFDQAIKIANNTIYGLTGSIYSFNRENILKGKKEFYVGNLYINRHCTGALVGVHPFGGFNMSGTDSKSGGRDYLALFTQAKVISEKYR
jgi:1-pyrroline-5-carboxylate dehydrogenase